MSSICYLRKKTTLGWGFLTAWGLIGMSLHATYAQSPSYEVAVIGSLANTCSFFAIALIAVLSSKRKQDTLSRSSGQYKKRLLISSFTVALVMTLVGSIFPLVPQMLFFQAGAVALAVASIGYAIMTIAWGVFYAQLDVQKIEQDSIYSTLVCALSYLVAIVLPHNASVLFRMLLPVLSFACYLSVLQNEPETKDGHSAQNELTPNRPASEVFPLSRAFSLIIFAIALSSTVLSSPAHLATMSSFFVIPQYVKLMPVATLSGLIMAVLLVIYCIVFARRINLSAFFHILCPLATLGLFLIVIPSAPLALIGYGLLLAAQWMLYLFVWIHAAELSNRSKINPVLALASLRFAFDLGFLISSALFPLFDKQEIPIAFIALGLSAAFSLTTLLPIERQLTDDEESLPDISKEHRTLEDLRVKQSHRFALLYNLSSREEQILGFVLRGYSVPAIRNELYIAKSTINTYIQRIYHKCNVHSRQELIELVNGSEATYRQPASLP